MRALNVGYTSICRLCALLALPLIVIALTSTPINPSGWPSRFPAKDHCSRCGLCETTLVSHVTDACAFLGDGMGRIDGLEDEVHGRRREDDLFWSKNDKVINPSKQDEGRFGVLSQPIALARGVETEAQWTGVVTGIAAAALEGGLVDAVVCVASGGMDSDFADPDPIIARTVEDVMRGRGVKPSLSPSLRVLDEVREDPAIRRLLFCGVGCAVQALRSVEKDLGLEELFVLGTNCADNSPTPQAAKNFLEAGVGVDDVSAVKGYEFMQDFRVHVKTDSEYTKKPYFCLPGTVAAPSIATSCLACFDYMNSLADVVVGYMGAPLPKGGRMDHADQTLTVRNTKGASLVDNAIARNRLNIQNPVAGGSGKHEKLASATVAKDSVIMSIIDENIPEKGMPRLAGEVMATVLGGLGPKGVAFAR